MREERKWIPNLQNKRFLKLGNRKSQSMKGLFPMFRNFYVVIFKRKRKKRSFCLFPIIIFIYLCSK